MLNSLLDNVDLEASGATKSRVQMLTNLTASGSTCMRKFSAYDDVCNAKTPMLGQTSFNQDQVVLNLFDAVKDPDSNKVKIKEVFDIITKAGFELTDPRIGRFMGNLSINASLSNKDISSPTHAFPTPNPMPLDSDLFCQAANDNLQLLMKIVSKDLCLRDFSAFRELIRELYESCIPLRDGSNANYIPQLAEVDPDKWGVSICTIDGQKCNFGDVTDTFTLQSTSKPLSYALAITEHGPEVVHQYVGYEPSGHKFNMVILNANNKPHNPLINSGAIVVTSLLKTNMSIPERFTYINREFARMSGGTSLGFNNAVYLSERSTADRNFSLGYYMREHKCFPPGAQLQDTLDLYFQTCSIENDTKGLAAIASTFANGGINPITGQRVLTAASVRDTLSVMHSCGMYDYSGQFAFKVGLPAKSGVSGAIMLVVPNLMGIAMWSPRIDGNGNSVRGIQFCQELVRLLLFHNYDSLLHSETKKLDPRKQAMEDQAHCVVRLLFAAKNNDISELRRCLIANYDLNAKDYDDRTGLHVAASTGSLEAVKFFIEMGRVDPNPLDRWQRTPYFDAKHFGHRAVCDYLKKHLTTQDLVAGSPTGTGIVTKSLRRDSPPYDSSCSLKKLNSVPELASAAAAIDDDPEDMEFITSNFKLEVTDEFSQS